MTTTPAPDPPSAATPAPMISPRSLEVRRIWAGYAVALLATSAAVGLRLLLEPWVQGRPLLIIFVFPIILSAYVGGLWPGVLSTLITVCGTKFFLIPPIYSLAFQQPLDLIQWTIMLGTGVLVSILIEGLHRARRRTQAIAAEARRAQDAAVHSQQRFRALIEHALECIVLVDAEHRIVYVSPSVIAVEGYTPEEIMGHDRFEHIHPDDQLYIRGAYEQLMVYPGKPIPAIWRRRHKDGRWIWLEGVGVNLLDNPHVRAIVLVYRDITARKQAESKIRAQLDHLDLLHQITRAISQRQDPPSILRVVAARLESQLPVDFSCVCLLDDADGVMRAVHTGDKSIALAEKLGTLPQSVIPIDGLGLSLRGVLVYEPDIGRLNFPLPQKLAAAGLRSVVIAPLQVEAKVFGILLVARQGTNRFAAAECDFLTQLCEHVALASHQSQLYQALQKAYDDLRQTQQSVMQQERLRALGQMASGIAHDINNAITPVSLYTESLLEHEPSLSGQGRGQLEMISRAIADVGHTVSRITEFCRQNEDGRAFAGIDINRLIEQVVEWTRARWHDIPQHRGVEITVATELAADVPPVPGAEAELREALINLVFNAIDAMPEGGRLTLRTLREASTGGPPHVRVEIADTGVGMDEATVRRCFEPFFTTKGDRGTGLGLSMVFAIIQRHDARIDIDSAPGKGTTVRIWLGTGAGSAAASSAATEIVPHGPMHILAVDDDPMLSRALQHMLESDGHRVRLCGGGQAGIDAFLEAAAGSDPFKLVITDLGMPIVDGRRLAAAIKKASPSTPVILLTGWGQRLVADHDIPEHVDRVLNKPPKMAELRRALAELTAPNPPAE